MTENIQTPQKDDFDTHFDSILEMQESSRAAQRLLEPSSEPETPLLEAHEQKKLPSTIKKIAAGALITAGSIGGIAAAGNALAGPDISVSEETTTYTVPDGGGLWDAAQAVENHETVDTRDLIEEIKNHPANISVLEDGLQAGESITIPVSVDPK